MAPEPTRTSVHLPQSGERYADKTLRAEPAPGEALLSGKKHTVMNKRTKATIVIALALLMVSVLAIVGGGGPTDVAAQNEAEIRDAAGWSKVGEAHSAKSTAKSGTASKKSAKPSKKKARRRGKQKKRRASQGQSVPAAPGGKGDKGD